MRIDIDIDTTFTRNVNTTTKKPIDFGYAYRSIPKFGCYYVRPFGVYGVPCLFKDGDNTDDCFICEINQSNLLQFAVADTEDEIRIAEILQDILHNTEFKKYFG